MWPWKKKTAPKPPEPSFRYPEGFLPRNRLRPEDALKASMHAFAKTDYRCMCFSNNEGDEVWFGELLGFQVFSCGAAHPVIRRDDGKEVRTMGFVLPLWKELAEFLAQLESRNRFWQMVTLLHGCSGIQTFDSIVWAQYHERD